MKYYISILMVLCVVCGANLTSGCKTSAETQAKNEHQYMLKSEALDKPMFEMTGTNILICITGSEQNPAVFRVYNPEIAAVIASDQPQSWYESAGSFFGGLFGAMYSVAGAASVASVPSNAVSETVVASTNVVMLYSESSKENTIK